VSLSAVVGRSLQQIADADGLWLALFTVMPPLAPDRSYDWANGMFAEPGAPEYSRVYVGPSAFTVTTPEGLPAITRYAAPAVAWTPRNAWGTVLGFGFYDSATAGIRWADGRATVPIAVVPNVPISFPQEKLFFEVGWNGRRSYPYPG
jgi:hypothetical protein